MVDAYHHLNALPFSLAHLGLEQAFVVGGGYKYCQLGEGNCFLRVPPGCTLRPVLTGWFAEFGALADGERPDRVAYAEGHGRFAGATYDPVSHYRAEAVIDFFRDQAMSPERLRALSQRQVRHLAGAIDALDLDPVLLTRDRNVPLAELGGFLALSTPRAAEMAKGLRRRGVSSDVRGNTLRLGPAPYVTTVQLDDAVDRLAEVVRESV